MTRQNRYQSDFKQALLDVWSNCKRATSTQINWNHGPESSGKTTVTLPRRRSDIQWYSLTEHTDPIYAENIMDIDELIVSQPDTGTGTNAAPYVVDGGFGCDRPGSKRWKQGWNWGRYAHSRYGLQASWCRKHLESLQGLSTNPKILWFSSISYVWKLGLCLEILKLLQGVMH